LGDLHTYQQQWQLGLPLFFQVPETTQYSAQTLITPSGELANSMCGFSTMVQGRCEAPIDEPEVESLMREYSRAQYDQGWQGSFNLQFKPDRQGIWKAHEINLPMSGGTSARMIFGYDELGTLLAHFYPQFDFPNFSHSEPESGRVYRVLTDEWVPQDWVACLTRTGQWQRFS
jgi:hypothetical protein